MKTYQEIFENALRRLNLSKKDVKDYRPASEVHIPEIKGDLPGAVIIWTNDGREILYREKSKKRCIEVYQHETIGSLIRRMLPGGLAYMSPKDPLQYYIPSHIWNSRIPEDVLLPEGGDLG